MGIMKKTTQLRKTGTPPLSARDLTFNKLRNDVEKSPTDLLAKATLGLFMFYEDGPSLSAARIGFSQQPAPSPDDVKRITNGFLRSLESKFQTDFDAASVFAGQKVALPPLLATHLDCRRALLDRYREQMVEVCWLRAIDLVSNDANRALEIYAQSYTDDCNVIPVAVKYFSTNRHGDDHFYGQIARRAQVVAERLQKDYTDLKGISDDELVALASTQYGGMRLMVATTLAVQLIAAFGILTHVLTLDSNHEILELLSGLDYSRFQARLMEVTAMPGWGDQAPLVRVLAENSFDLWPGIASGIVGTNALVAEILADKVENEKLARKVSSLAERESARMMRRLQEVERQLSQSQKAAADVAEMGVVIAPLDATVVQQELFGLRKKTARLQQELDNKSMQLADTRSLLDSVLAEPMEPLADAAPMTPQEIRKLRGVVIGGHVLFTNKLRKLLPDCLFYSADQQRVDDAAVRNREFILFFAGYCNHALADNALRLARQNAIPCGYTTHVNMTQCLQDVARLRGRVIGETVA